MRVYISVDMEGIAGVTHEDQADPIEPRHAGEYNRFRRLMTNEANAAIAGALEAGAETILVNDSHWLMRNLLAEELNPAAELLSGGPKRLSMVEGIDGGFDAAMFIGYHARAGTRNATIDHTYTSRVYEARLNGEPAGELALNAAMAGVHGVSVALRRKHKLLKIAPPIRLEVDFALTQMADMAELVPGSSRTAGRTIEYIGDDYREVFRAWRAMYNLASVE
jgi:D-amino peptidase